MSLYEKALLVIQHFNGYKATIKEAAHITRDALTIVFTCPPSERILINTYMLVYELKPSLDVTVCFRDVTGEIVGSFEALCVGKGDEAVKENFIVQDSSTPIFITLKRDDDMDAKKDDFDQIAEGKYETTCVGGTFDHIHPGHKVLLTVCAVLARKSVVIGLSTDALLQNKEYRDFLEAYDTREQTVREFLRIIAPETEIEIVPLRDPYGPTIERSDLKALIVSKETEEGARQVNEERAKRQMPPMDIHVIDCLDDTFKLKLSSTAIRKTLFEKQAGSSSKEC